MIRKMVIAFLSSLIYSIILGGIQPLTSYSIHTHLLNALFFMMFIAPAQFVLGIPVSYLIDKITNKKTFQLIAYIIFGFLGGILVFLVISFIGIHQSKEFFTKLTSFTVTQYFQFGLFGLGGSLLFFFFSLTVDSFFTNRNQIRI